MAAAAGRRLLKGEGIDVSLPTRRDINLQLWVDGEALRPGPGRYFLDSGPLLVLTLFRQLDGTRLTCMSSAPAG